MPPASQPVPWRGRTSAALHVSGLVVAPPHGTLAVMPRPGPSPAQVPVGYRSSRSLPGSAGNEAPDALSSRSSPATVHQRWWGATGTPMGAPKPRAASRTPYSARRRARFGSGLGSEHAADTAGAAAGCWRWRTGQAQPSRSRARGSSSATGARSQSSTRGRCLPASTPSRVDSTAATGRGQPERRWRGLAPSRCAATASASQLTARARRRSAYRCLERSLPQQFHRQRRRPLRFTESLASIWRQFCRHGTKSERTERHETRPFPRFAGLRGDVPTRGGTSRPELQNRCGAASRSWVGSTPTHSRHHRARAPRPEWPAPHETFNDGRSCHPHAPRQGACARPLSPATAACRCPARCAELCPTSRCRQP